MASCLGVGIFIAVFKNAQHYSLWDYKWNVNCNTRIGLESLIEISLGVFSLGVYPESCYASLKGKTLKQWVKEGVSFDFMGYTDWRLLEHGCMFHRAYKANVYLKIEIHLGD